MDDCEGARQDGWEKASRPICTSLDIIIPVKNRDLGPCVASLGAALARLDLGNLPTSKLTPRILICDGGSTDSKPVEVLAALSTAGEIILLSAPQTRFNKAALLNLGIRQSQAEVLLLSDADILWNAEAIAALLMTLADHPTALCHVAHVTETDDHAIALSRPRYGYTLHTTAQGATLTLDWVTTTPTRRPGCGLLCARRETLLQLGGYKECFQGWGWEDQDLLIRAELLGYACLAAGTVQHQSHPDTQRNQDYQGVAPSITRDRNLLACLRSLQAGHLYGDLTHAEQTQIPPPSLHLQLPPSLATQLRQIEASNSSLAEYSKAAVTHRLAQAEPPSAFGD